MVEYKCFRCGYSTTHKASLINHLKRKNICNPTLEDISIENIIKYYRFEMTPKQHLNDTQTAPFDTQNKKMDSTQIAPSEHPNSTLGAPKQHLLGAKKNMCEFCEKTFTRKTGLTKHLKCCKYKKICENKKDNEIQELKEMVEKLLVETKGNTNITNNMNNSNNTTNNIININNYGDENTKYITSDYILKLLKYKPAKAIPELIKHTHFNEEHPENQNIKITNKKEPYIKVLKNDKWELQDKEETITDLIDRQQIHLLDETVEKKIENNCSNTEKNNINRCSNLYNEENKEYMKKLYSESELIIINNS